MDWWFDPGRNFGDNVAHGPFGAFARPAPGEHGARSALTQTGSTAPLTTLFGDRVRTPFGIAAGPLPTARHCAAAFAHGFDINVYKTVRSRAVEAHPFPNTLAVRIEGDRSEEHTSELQSRPHLVCRLLLEKKNLTS